MLGLALGTRIPSDILYNALSPPRFQIERLEICELKYNELFICWQMSWYVHYSDK